MKRYILIAIVLCLWGCDNEDPNPADNTVHLGGYVSDTNGDGDGVASYWKDGVYTGLTSGNIISRVSSMHVDGSSVLFGGVTRTPNSPIESVMWQDGNETTIDGVFGEPMIASRNNNLFGVWLTTGKGWEFHRNGVSQSIIDTAYNFAPMAMTVDGDNVFISGYSSGPPTPPNYSPPQHAQYWKNGQLIFREDEFSNGLSIVTHENDVYMAGVFYPPGGLATVACYWKNGQRVDLTEDNGIAIARSIFVTNSHVYVSGMIDNEAVYWKDGEVVYLPAEETNSMANSIFVKGDDVHVGGYVHGHPAYWKNNERQDIPNQDKFGQIKFVVVGSN
jgi:hypothetical protein